MIKKILLAVLTVLAMNSYADNLTILVGFPPGGGNYIVGQLISETGIKLGYKNAIEIKAGAGGIIGMNECVSRVDDKNLICITSQAQYAYSIIPSLDEVRKFDPQTLTYIKMVGFTPNVLITNPKNTKSLPEVLGDLKSSKPVSFASGALGLRILSSLLIKETDSKNAIIAEYKGVGPAVIDVMGGHVDYAFVPYTTIQSQVSSGLVRIVANAGADADELKEYPKLRKFVPNILEDSTMFGFVTGPGTDETTVASHNNMLTHILEDKQLQEKFKKVGIFPMPSNTTSEDFRKFAQEERTKFTNQLKLVPIQ
jgi:tripartite-type tricarboxylate transporter receptor subunit TctC